MEWICDSFASLYWVILRLGYFYLELSLHLIRWQSNQRDCQQEATGSDPSVSSIKLVEVWATWLILPVPELQFFWFAEGHLDTCNVQYNWPKLLKPEDHIFEVLVVYVWNWRSAWIERSKKNISSMPIFLKTGFWKKRFLSLQSVKNNWMWSLVVNGGRVEDNLATMLTLSFSSHQ